MPGNGSEGSSSRRREGSNGPAGSVTGQAVPSVPVMEGATGQETRPRRERSTCKYWCFTLNNPTEEEVSAYEQVLSSAAVRYGIFQREVGTLGTPHLQGYFELQSPRALSTVRQMFPRIHAERRRGTRDQARDYCLKSDTAVPGTRKEFGDWASGGSGARNDIREVTRFIDEGATPKDVILRFPEFVCRYHRFPQLYFNAKLEERHWKTKVLAFVGKTGAGKSRLARELFPKLYSKPPGSNPSAVWFDNYAAQRHVLIDDFRGTDMPFEFLLQLLDRYGMQVPTKGSFAQFVPYVIVITSDRHPMEWYNRDCPDRNDQLIRRIDYIVDKWPVNAVLRAELSQLTSYGYPGGLPLILNE